MNLQRITHRLKGSLALPMVFLLVFMQTAHAGNYIAFIHTDVLGSPVAVTDQNGNIVSREHVSPYGDSLGKRSEDDSTPVGSSEHGIGYTGHVKDKDLGLTYMQARYYDPTIGRFMGTDPVGFKATNPELFNRYAYANNNPYSYVDPDGEFAILGIAVAKTLTYTATSLVGIMAGVAIQEEVIQPMLNEEIEEEKPNTTTADDADNPNDTDEAEAVQKAKDSKRMSDSRLEIAAKNNGYEGSHDLKQDFQLDSDRDIFVDSDGALYEGPRQGTGIPQPLDINEDGSVD